MNINELQKSIGNLEYELEYGEQQNIGRVLVDVNYLRPVIDFANETIVRQSTTNGEVARAIEYLEPLTKYATLTGQFAIHLKTIIAALQEYQPWISVKDRLPDDGVPVLVAYVGRNDGKLHSDGVALWCDKEIGYGGEWLWELDRSEAADEITHWKTLPEPPKGETDGD